MQRESRSGDKRPERPRAMAEIARRLGVLVPTIEISGPDELGAAFEAFRGGRAEGVNIVSSAMLVSFRRPIGELSLGAKIPSICQFRNMAESRVHRELWHYN